MDQSTKASKARRRDPETKLAQHRLSVLELAKELGNVAEACRQRGLDRTSFYEWKRRFQTQGFEGLKDLPPIHKSHPQTTPPETVERIRALALAHPAYGCNRFEAMLALEGVRVSSITIQKTLNENGLGTKSDRWLTQEQTNAETAIELTPEQAAFIEKLNPCFRERHVESSASGELLSANTFFVGSLKGSGASTCTQSWTPSALMPLTSCTSPSSPRLRWRCCTTTCCRSTATLICRSAQCSPTMAFSSPTSPGTGTPPIPGRCAST